MIAIADLRSVAEARLRDAQVLLQEGRYDGAAYLAGYAVEIAIKARICQTLGWTGFPESRREFEGYASFKTHDLAVLLHLSGQESAILERYKEEWDRIVAWTPEERYSSVGSVEELTAHERVVVTRILIERLLDQL